MDDTTSIACVRWWWRHADVDTSSSSRRQANRCLCIQCRNHIGIAHKARQDWLPSKKFSSRDAHQGAICRFCGPRTAARRHRAWQSCCYRRKSHEMHLRWKRCWGVNNLLKCPQNTSCWLCKCLSKSFWGICLIRTESTVVVRFLKDPVIFFCCSLQCCILKQ